MNVLGTVTVIEVFRVEVSSDTMTPDKATDALVAAFHSGAGNVEPMSRTHLITTLGVCATPEEIAKEAVEKARAARNED